MMDRETLTISETAEILGIGRGTCYELARQNKLPVQVLRLGRRLVVSKTALLKALDGTKVEIVTKRMTE